MSIFPLSLKQRGFFGIRFYIYKQESSRNDNSLSDFPKEVTTTEHATETEISSTTTTTSTPTTTTTTTPTSTTTTTSALTPTPTLPVTPITSTLIPSSEAENVAKTTEIENSLPEQVFILPFSSPFASFLILCQT